MVIRCRVLYFITSTHSFLRVSLLYNHSFLTFDFLSCVVQRRNLDFQFLVLGSHCGDLTFKIGNFFIKLIINMLPVFFGSAFFNFSINFQLFLINHFIFKSQSLILNFSVFCLETCLQHSQFLFNIFKFHQLIFKFIISLIQFQIFSMQISFGIMLRRFDIIYLLLEHRILFEQNLILF